MLTHLAAADDPVLDTWVPEQELWHEVFSNYSKVRHVRHRLKRLADDGLIDRRRTRPPRSTVVVSLGQLGRERLEQHYAKYGRKLPEPTRPPRLDQSIHHLLVVAASIQILQQAKGRLLRLLGDESLRSSARSGRTMEAGSSDVKLPDGRLTFRGRGAGDPTRIDIEILVSKYTNEQIQAKIDELGPTGTLFFAPTSRLCERTYDLTGVRPILLT